MTDEDQPTGAPEDAQAVLTVDLEALDANWRWLQSQAAPALCAAVIKADAYGIGIDRAVPALARAGCRVMFTAHVAEGVRARHALRTLGLGDREARVYVLNGFHPGNASPMAWRDAALSPVIGSAEELTEWCPLAAAMPDSRSALHVDTGMNRLGFGPEAAYGLDASTVAAARADLLMSHFISAEIPDAPSNAVQIARFEALRNGPLGTLPASLANSSGILLPQRPHYDLVRPGYALYGGNPTPSHPNPMRPVVTLRARLLQVRRIAAGEPAGYGAAWIARRPSTLATIGVGYADGYPRGARTAGEPGGPVALVGDTRCPLVGRVSMDLSIVDVTDADPAHARPGAMVELLGPTITVDDLGAACGTIGYEILTRLGRRYRRQS